METIIVLDGKAFTVDKNYDLIPAIDGVYEIKSKKKDTRTALQNNALHKYFSMVAESLNLSGQYILKVIKIDLPWTKESVKELLWKSVQEQMLGKRSTTKLTKDEVTKVYDVLNRALGERCGVSVEFPSREE